MMEFIFLILLALLLVLVAGGILLMFERDGVLNQPEPRDVPDVYGNTLRVICCACQTVIQEGGLATSHGLCHACFERITAEYRASLPPEVTARSVLRKINNNKANK